MSFYVGRKHMAIREVKAFGGVITTKHHYHEETWTYELKGNVMNVDNTVVRVPLMKQKK